VPVSRETRGNYQVPLNSRLFKGVKELEACLVSDAAHVTPGSRGEHVKLIQRALVMCGDRTIPTTEYADGQYGPSTAAAVLRYKEDRAIVNHSYQSAADNIVGKMTIAALDKEVLGKQDLPPRP
jgi:hypothetical protein